jgi:Mg-chelatase subunit ChlD
VNNLLSNVQYSGLTPLATALQAKVLQPIVFNLAAAGQLQKPVLIIAITDGEPTDNPRDLVVQVGVALPVHMYLLSASFRADLSLRKHV